MKRFLRLLILFLAAFAFLVQPAVAGTPSTAKKNTWTAKQAFKHGFSGVTFYEDLPLAAAYVNGGGVITTSTTPDLPATAVDNIPAIWYNASTETTSVGWSFILPADYAGSLAFRMMLSSASDTTPASLSIDWDLYINKDNTAFDVTPIAQDAVALASTDTPASKNVALEFTANKTALDSLKAGDLVTVYFWPSDTRSLAAGTGTVEIKGVRRSHKN